MSEREALAEALYVHRGDMVCFDHPESYCCACGAHEVGGYREHLTEALTRLLADAEQRGYERGVNDTFDTDGALMRAEQRGAARVAAAVEAVCAKIDRHTDVEQDDVEFRDADTGVWWDVTETIRAALATGAAERVRAEACGHPNHGSDDHDCRPFANGGNR